ncbi:zinc finger domain-containing protein [Streptomyces decoyicus]|uniref:zinc finger domain-containing protein n=1 Tax=Streptomyces decoyicus TaxID=249567 RepID=UPI0033BA7F73
MDRRELAALLAYIGRLDPRTIRTDKGEARDQLATWHELLGDVPMTTPHGWDARTAARQHIRVSPYQVLPADIARPWESYRRDRLARHTDPTPGADPDDQAAWTAELVGTRRAVAAGSAQPAQYRAITSSQLDPDLKTRLRKNGSCIPPEARVALAPYRPARAAREAAVAQGQPDALGVRCEWCQAQIGEPCRRRRVAPDGGARGTAPRVTPHPGRLDLAAARQAQETEQVQPALA